MRAAEEFPPWKISGWGAAFDRIGTGAEGEVVDGVEVAAVLDVLLGEELADDVHELRGPAVAFAVFEPRQAEAGVFVLEPAGDDVDRSSALAELVGGEDELREHGRFPDARVDGGDDL